MKSSLQSISLGVALLTGASPAYGDPPAIVAPTSGEWDEIYVPASRAPTEVKVGSKLRSELFDLLRAEADPATRFSGRLKAYRNWAFFLGSTVDEAGKSKKNPPLGNDDAVALWLRTQRGWTLVAHSFGHSDAFYVIWPEKFGAPRELFGMNANSNATQEDAADAGKDASPAPPAGERAGTDKPGSVTELQAKDNPAPKPEGR
jgi:hypothetical protein